MSKQVECVKIGKHGDGSLRRFDDSPNWISCYSHHGKQHRESTGTADIKAAKRWHKKKLDELSADRTGLRKFIAPMAQQVTVGNLLDDYTGDIRLREAKSVDKMLAHMKPIRAHFGNMRAVDLTADAVDKYIAERLKAGKSHATVNRGTMILATAFKLAHRRGKC